ncbi:MAG: hypothetical protein KBD05_03510 [Candidatus Pacebacteria bacterium]|nr:hypothetical protein [Candidatus Paceibacterota bacterium]
MATKKTLSVRLKILLTVAASVVALLLAIYAISNAVLLKSYLDIEEAGMHEDLRRAGDAIEEFSNQQMIKLSDWAAWDDAYEFALDRDPVWAEETVYATGLANLDINGMLWSDTEGKIFHLLAVDISERTEVASTTLATYFAAHPELIQHTELTDQTQGIALLPDGPLLLVSLPLRTSEGEGPIPGSLTFVRYLDEEKISQLADITHLDMKVFPYDGKLPANVADAKAQLASGSDTVIVPVSKNQIVGYSLMKGVDGNPALILRVETPRPVYAQGLLTFYLFMGIGAVALLLFGIVILWLLDRLVIARFMRLTSDVDRINEGQDLSIRLAGGVKDEIGKLADNVNQMLAWLSASRTETKHLLEEVKIGKEHAEDLVKVRTKELAEEKARLLASINSLGFGFVIAAIDGAILLKNPALSRILTFPEPPDRSSDLSRVLAGSFDLDTFCTETVARGVPGEKSDIVYGKQILRILCAPINAEEGAGAIGYVLLIEDITEAKVMQRSREEFFSIASHELRTPLTAIRGNTGLLLDTYKDRLPDPEMREMLEDINASSGRLITMVNDFLQVSRLEQGKIEIKRESFNLVPVIEEVVRSLTELAKQKGLTLSCTPTDLPPVLADADRTEQVLENLVGNAIKFTEKGGITISAEQTDTEVIVRVKDTGVGISEQNQTLLFRKFQQAGEDTLARDNSQSTGLGLYISKLIMNSMGGKIVLEESEFGKGSTFSFTLPRA